MLPASYPMSLAPDRDSSSSGCTDATSSRQHPPGKGRQCRPASSSTRAGSCSLADVTTSASNSPGFRPHRVSVRPCAALMTIAAPDSALRGRLDAAAVKNVGPWKCSASHYKTQNDLHELLTTACVEPAAYLLVDDRPERQIGRQHAPMNPGLTI